MLGLSLVGYRLIVVFIRMKYQTDELAKQDAMKNMSEIFMTCFFMDSFELRTNPRFLAE